MRQVLGACGLLDFTMLRPVLAWGSFETYEPFISLIARFFFSGRGEPRILNQWIRGHDCILGNYAILHWHLVTDVEPDASTFRVYFDCYSLKMEAVYSSETTVTFYQWIQPDIPKDINTTLVY
jgi:hypothetical protein